MIRRRLVYILFLQLAVVANLSAQAGFTASSVEGCTPFSVAFQIDESTVDMDTISRIDWYFGTGDTVNAISPDSMIYDTEGVYTVTMVVNRHHENPVIKTDYITVHRTVSAAFQYEEYAPNNNFRFIPADEITDVSASYTFLWDYMKEDGSDSRTNSYAVTLANQLNAVDSVTLDTGVYVINLTITDNFGCESSFSQRLSLAGELVIPNIFFPEVEEFFIVESRSLTTAIRFQVFNRYGLLVFTQTAPTIAWNGKTNNGTPLSSGVYYYILEILDGSAGEPVSQRGFIHMYR
ncbi:MAG: gliding motility-associated C-terminal domain-containing protein [Bacteroidales bacterium]|nr:gliding motility-associated C-terminal domain-containing protein [Bacteroidales bacterium]